MEKTRIRLAVAGMHIESGTLSPLETEQHDFLASRGTDLMERYPFLQERSGELGEIEWVPLAHFRAMPGGVVRRDAYQAMKDEILERLREAGRLDGFYFDIHGAMTVDGLEDAELDLLYGIREVLGKEVPVSCSQDLHGNVSAELIRELNCITAYRTAPHIDFMETRQRAMEQLVRMVRSEKRPARAWVGIPVLLSGEMTSTEVEPGRSLWAGLEHWIDGEAVWDVSLWAGYPWADQKRAMASIVVTGMDAGQVKKVAEVVALKYWQAREQFQFLSPAMPVNEAFQQLDKGGLKQPVFFSDAGDNPTAGGAGDTTGVLSDLLDWANGEERHAIFSSIPDSEAVKRCFDAGLGETLTLELGGKLDSVHSSPLPVTGTIVNYSERDDRFGPEAVLRSGNVSIILSSHRRPYHLREDYLGLGLDPLEVEVTVVKIGYLEPELRAMAGSHILLLSQGGVNPALESIKYQHIERPMFPWDRDFDWQAEARVLAGQHVGTS